MTDPDFNKPYEPRPGALNFLNGIVRVFLTSLLSPLFIIVVLLLGAMALFITPREEDPQIVVPMVDVWVEMPGATVLEVERLATTPLESICWEIPGVENVYSISQTGGALVTVRFYVGEDREESLTKVMVKLEANRHRVPSGVRGWQIRPVDVDDIPIVMLSLFSPDLDDGALREIALEVKHELQGIPDVALTEVVGGRKQEVTVHLDPNRLAARGLTPLEVSRELQACCERIQAGKFWTAEGEAALEIGPFLTSPDEVRAVVVGVENGRAIRLSDVADVKFGLEEPSSYTRFTYANCENIPEGYTRGQQYASVTLALAKRTGTNAVNVAENVLERVEELKGNIIPENVRVEVTRNYGATANDKVNNLVASLALAVATVLAIIGIFLNWRAALVIAIVIPMVLSITLIVDFIFGYTINRVTLFALILSLGLLVDDPIVDVENIVRHFRLRKRDPLNATLEAIDEIRDPMILTTLTAVVTFLPMFFITGMMGPYMGPMAFNLPVTLIASTILSLTITPWATYHLLKKEYEHRAERSVTEVDDDVKNTVTYRAYAAVVKPLLTKRSVVLLFLGILIALFLGSLGIVGLGGVPLKMLPFDNKNELQIVLDLPEGVTLEDSDRVASHIGDFLLTVPEVKDFQIYSGIASPMDFNGLVRHYFLRSSSNVAEIRINLLPRLLREQQSHTIAMRIRQEIEAIAKPYNTIAKIVELPPGPPVLSTLVAEVYATQGASYDEQYQVANQVAETIRTVEGIADVDLMMFDAQPMLHTTVDLEKAALHGIPANSITNVLKMAVGGEAVGVLRTGNHREPIQVVLRLPAALRRQDIFGQQLQLRSKTSGALVPLVNLVSEEWTQTERSIFHKDLRRVVYVTAEQVGVSPVNAMFAAWDQLDAKEIVPPGFTLDWAGEGEWKITLEVFRDLGIAFVVAQLFIYLIFVGQTDSLAMPLVLMVAIPLTAIGVFPGFWMLNSIFTDPVNGSIPDPIFFTATAMIGMIALSGIVVRNSILLIDFIEQKLAEGNGTLMEAILESGAVRLRPIFLTAGTSLFGSWVITLDPIFSGLAWAFIFGIFASTVFTLIVIPVIYYYLKRRNYPDPLPPEPICTKAESAPVVVAESAQANAESNISLPAEIPHPESDQRSQS